MDETLDKKLSKVGWIYFGINLFLIIPHFFIPITILRFKSIYLSMDVELGMAMKLITNYPFTSYFVIAISMIFFALAFVNKRNRFFYYIFLELFIFNMIYMAIIVFALFLPVMSVESVL